jgi:coatomer subunit alpha
MHNTFLTADAAIMITNNNFSMHSLIHETICIKSGAWDDTGMLIYSTLNHMKYCLSQGLVFSWPIAMQLHFTHS